jgi:hypothetical protein
VIHGFKTRETITIEKTYFGDELDSRTASLEHRSDLFVWIAVLEGMISAILSS